MIETRRSFANVPRSCRDPPYSCNAASLLELISGALFKCPSTFVPWLSQWNAVAAGLFQRSKLPGSPNPTIRRKNVILTFAESKIDSRHLSVRNRYKYSSQIAACALPG